MTRTLIPVPTKITTWVLISPEGETHTTDDLTGWCRTNIHRFADKRPDAQGDQAVRLANRFRQIWSKGAVDKLQGWVVWSKKSTIRLVKKPVSHQRRWQIKCAETNRCVSCGKPLTQQASPGGLDEHNHSTSKCPTCRELHRRRSLAAYRRRRGLPV